MEQCRQIVHRADGEVIGHAPANAWCACRAYAPGLLCALVLLTLLDATALATGEDGFRTLRQTPISAQLAGNEVTDGVHWADQYMRDGTCKAFHMSKATMGRSVCPQRSVPRGRDNRTGMQESSTVGHKNRVSGPGSGLPPFEGVLKEQQPRS